MSSLPAEPMKLYYFAMPGRAASIRMACAYGRIPLEDILLTPHDHTRLREAGKLRFGQLPALELPDGRQITQSHSILRFIGKRSSPVLHPEDAFEAALVDSVLDQVADMDTVITAFRFPDRFGLSCISSGQAHAGATEKMYSELKNVLPERHLLYFEKLLQESSTGWLCGTPGPTIADFAFVCRFTNISRFFPDISMDSYPGCMAHREQFKKLPIIEDIWPFSYC